MHHKGAKPNTILPSVGFPSQHHLVYFPREDNVEKLYDARSRCLQILSPSEMNPCLMLSPVPQNVERDPQKHERAQHEAEINNVSTDSEFSILAHGCAGHASIVFRQT